MPKHWILNDEDREQRRGQMNGKKNIHFYQISQLQYKILTCSAEISQLWTEYSTEQEQNLLGC